MPRPPSRRPVPVSVTVASRLRVANDFLVMSRYADVRRLALDVLAEEPNSSLALSFLARALSGLQEHDAAVETVRQSVALAPLSYEAHWSSGWVLFRAGDIAAARTSFEQALAIQPRSVQSHIMLGKALYRLKFHTQALAEIDAALAIDPRDADAWATRSMFLSYPSRSAESRAAAEEALRFAPNQARSHFAGGFSAMVSDDPQRAAEEFREGMRLDPHNTNVKNAYVTVSKRLLPLYAQLFGAPKWPNILFLLAFLGFARDWIVSAGTMAALITVAILNRGATVESGWIILAAFMALVAFHNWAYALFIAFAALLVTLFVLGSAELITILIVSRERLVRNALTKRHRETALWFVANLPAFVIFSVAGTWLRDGGLSVIGMACGTAAFLTAIYGRTFDQGNAALYASSKAGLQVTIIGQIGFVAMGIAEVLTSPPAAANAAHPLDVTIPHILFIAFAVPLILIAGLNALLLAVYLLALGAKALKDSNLRKKGLRTNHV